MDYSKIAAADQKSSQIRELKRHILFNISNASELARTLAQDNLTVDQLTNCWQSLNQVTEANFRNLNELALLTGAISVMPVSPNGNTPHS